MPDFDPSEHESSDKAEVLRDNGAVDKWHHSRSGSDWPELASCISELSHAGLPLPLTLRTAAEAAASPSAARALEAAARRLDSGVPLAAAVRDSGLPSAETLVGSLEAGHRAGDLHCVLEPVVRCKAVERQLRQRIRASLVYPFLVVTTGLLLGWSILSSLLVIFDRYADMSGFDSTTAMPWVSASLAAVPILSLAFAGIEVLRALRSDRTPFAWCGPIKATIEQLRFYRLTSHLAILVDADVPLPDALEISGQSAGGDLVEQSNDLAESIRQGQPLEDRLASFRGAPPVMRALLGSLSLAGTPDDTRGEHSARADRQPLALGTRLHAASDMLARSLDGRLDSLNRSIGFFIAVVLGLGVLGFALAFFWPLVHAYTLSAMPPELL